MNFIEQKGKDLARGIYHISGVKQISSWKFTLTWEQKVGPLSYVFVEIRLLYDLFIAQYTIIKLHDNQKLWGNTGSLA